MASLVSFHGHLVTFLRASDKAGREYVVEKAAHVRAARKQKGTRVPIALSRAHPIT